MGGTVKGGIKAAETNKRLYGDGLEGRPNFYQLIGHKGGVARSNINRGFARDPELASRAGRKGAAVVLANKAAKSA